MEIYKQYLPNFQLKKNMKKRRIKDVVFIFCIIVLYSATAYICGYTGVFVLYAACVIWFLLVLREKRKPKPKPKPPNAYDLTESEIRKICASLDMSCMYTEFLVDIIIRKLTDRELWGAGYVPNELKVAAQRKRAIKRLERYIMKNGVPKCTVVTKRGD